MSAEPLTGAELAEIEAQLREIAAYWDKPALVPAIHPDMVFDLVAEIRRLRGMKCQTCREWSTCLWPDVGECSGATGLHAEDVGILTKPDFGCNQWRPRDG